MASHSRRDLAKLLGAVAVSTALPGQAPALARPVLRRFPAGFRWGCATAAYQIEGAVTQDGRGPSIWDAFSHLPGKIRDGSNGDVACDSYNRHGEDTRLLKNLGANAYRFSIAWPRIFPEGRGPVNQPGIDHYKRMIDGMLENGIEPYVTLYHWDLPTGLSGGWQSRDTARAFADYAGYVASQLGDRVRNWMTLNEIGSFIDMGYGGARHAPGLSLRAGPLNQTRHHALLGHGLALQSIRAGAGRGARVGLAENPIVMIPVIETAEHIAAAKRAFRLANASRLTAILDGAYMPEWLAQQGANAPVVQEGDMRAIGGRLDFVGMNIYTGLYIRADAGPTGYAMISGSASFPNMGLDWLRVAPESAYWGPRIVNELWRPRALYISENGSVARDRLVNDQVGDSDRIMFLRNYLTQMQRATAEGIPLKGYFLWSLLDNFEWAEGYTARFGIHYTDYATQRRIPKLSAQWYKEVIARNGVV
jgi:beta-glucosidase